MNELLARIIDAHGGMERWNGHEKVNATIVSGGGLFPLKGVPQDSNPLARAEPSNVETPSARLLKHCSLINCAFQFVSSESLAVAEFDHIRLANGRLERAHNRVEDLAAIASG